MKSKRLLTLAFLLFWARPASGQDQLVDRVVAVVNDEAVTQSELDVYLRPLYQELSQQYEGEALVRQLNRFRLKLLNQIIEDRLVFQEAKTQGINVDEGEIDQRVDELKSRFASEKEFQETLAKQGLSLVEVREKYRREIAIRKLHDVQIRARVVVSPQEIEDFYKNRKSELAEEEGIRLRSLTIRKSAEAVQKGIADEEAKRKIESFEERIRNGEAFEKLAREFSEDPHREAGGEIGWVKRGEMLPAIDEVIFDLPAGGISSVLETQSGYHLFKVEEKKVNRIPSFEEARDRIQAILFHEEAGKRFKEWMDELKARSYISIR